MEKKQLELANFMKGVAICAIVLFHLIFDYLDKPDIVATASNFGGAGIHIFFLWSGFGLTLSALRRPLAWWEFLRKRAGKIYIPYILVVLISAALPFMYSGDDRLLAVTSHVFLFKMFVPAYNISFGAQFWFVSTIFQFYLVFHLLERARNVLGSRKFLLICCGGSLIWMGFTALSGLYPERIWGSFFLQYLWEFGFGMCLGDAYHRQKLELSGLRVLPTAAVTVVSLLIYGLMALKGGALTAFNDVFGAAAMSGICLLLYRLPWLRPLFCRINGFSYELYLVHILIFELCEGLLGPHLPNVVWCIIALVMAVLCSVGYHRYTGRLTQIVLKAGSVRKASRHLQQ